MAADAFKVYNQAKEFIGDGTIDLDAGAGYFSFILLDSGHTADITDSTYADVSLDELATANGYTVGGDVVSTPTWTHSAGTVTFDSDDPSWTASGGNIQARFGVLVHIAAGTGLPQSTDKLMAYSLLDNAPADVTATNGNAFTIEIAAGGVFTVSGGS